MATKKEIRDLLMKSTMEKAKELLVQEGHLDSIAAIFTPGEQPEVFNVCFQNDEEKERAHLELGIRCAVHGAALLIMVNDVAMKKYSGAEEYEKAANDPTERPLSYPPSMRTEGILISCLDFTTGERQFMLQPYKVVDEKIEFLPVDDQSGLEMKSHLLDLVQAGHDQALKELPGMADQIKNLMGLYQAFQQNPEG